MKKRKNFHEERVCKSQKEFCVTAARDAGFYLLGVE